MAELYFKRGTVPYITRIQKRPAIQGIDSLSLNLIPLVTGNIEEKMDSI